MPQVLFLQFSQFGSTTSDDDLLLFSAKAKDLANWAGIPRKGWRIRMLFQRPVTQARANQVSEFWDVASKPDPGQKFILGPTAITIGIQGAPVIIGDQLSLDYDPIIDITKPAPENLRGLSELVYREVRKRLNDEQQSLLDQQEASPYSAFPDIEHDYVFEFALQLVQMQADPDRFIDLNSLTETEVYDLITAMESVCRPAIVVDGQHRLIGASNSTQDIWLPVVAIPNCSWQEQIYQFVVINEKAQKVETTILTDIFGSSLTKDEQTEIRKKLARSNTNIEERILAVVANRDSNSPFFNMVNVKLDGPPPPGVDPYISDNTIRLLIEGSPGRRVLGWRTHTDFYDKYVSRTFPEQGDWDNWYDGAWRAYWFTFWRAVSDYYNDQAEKAKATEPLWSPTQQTNLTKAVTLRVLQSLFMTKVIQWVDQIANTESILIETLGEEAAREKIEQQRQQRSIPATKEEFRDFVETFFLDKGIPVRVFLYPWVSSLDDSTGTQQVWDELEQAWEKTQKGERYRAEGPIFRRGG